MVNNLIEHIIIPIAIIIIIAISSGLIPCTYVVIYYSIIQTYNYNYTGIYYILYNIIYTCIYKYI